MDVDSLLKKIKSKQPANKYYAYIKLRKNIIYSNDKDTEIQNSKRKFLDNQTSKEKIIMKELEIFDSFKIPFIGMKGPFVKSEFYGHIPRSYNDLDLLVEAKNVSVFYKALKTAGYRIKKKTYYDIPNINMKLFPEKYMNNTQTLMLINTDKNISIDMHCNLNITNAHFKKSDVQFSTSKLFENSIPYRNFHFIRQFDLYDNICFSIRHLLKHHVFYGKTQQGLGTMVQHILDLAMMINSKDFNEEKLLYRVIQYNIMPEALFCLDLYNKIFISFKKVTLNYYLSYVENANVKFKWKPIVLASIKMNPEDIMIGDFSDQFPTLQKAIDFSNSLPKFWMNWIIQRLFISLNIKLFLR